MIGETIVEWSKNRSILRLEIQKTHSILKKTIAENKFNKEILRKSAEKIRLLRHLLISHILGDTTEKSSSSERKTE